MRSLPSTTPQSQHFARSPQATIPRSKFDRSHGCKTTFDAGYLIPVLTDEALPGDTLNLKMTAFARLATPLFPFMDNLYMDTFFFAVPYRLVWDNWEKFNGEQRDIEDSTDYLVPSFAGTHAFSENSLADYFGIPTKVTLDISKVNTLFFRAYNLIYDEWFRDENLQNSTNWTRGDGPDTLSDYSLKRRGKRKDYFTSALPWPQKGPAINLPLGDSAPVVGTGLNTNITQVATPSYTVDKALQLTSSGGNVQTGAYLGNNPDDMYFTGTTSLEADLSDATASTINALREAFQIQKLYERDARGGTRYTEILKSHFGVTSPDSRLQRPEYLGGGSAPIIINSVPQTSASTVDSPQGNLAAFGTTIIHNHGFSKSFTEHCLILGLVSVRADLTYQQGINRMHFRQTRFDYYWPSLSHLGEQTILNKEIYATGTPETDEEVFGYQERYAEYRYKPSLITGNFRSNHTDSLDPWHLAQDFGSLPTLNSAFIQENPPIDRVKALGDSYPDFISDFYFKYICARPMPVYSVPGLIDHF